jgi:sulfate/thiosulfate transport system permease protein
MTKRVIPGYGLSLGITLAFLTTIILIPLAALFIKAAGLGPAQWFEILTSPRVLAAFRLTFGASAAAAAVPRSSACWSPGCWCATSSPAGVCLDGMVDLPFALPTAVAGITLAQLYGPNGWIGASSPKSESREPTARSVCSSPSPSSASRSSSAPFNRCSKTCSGTGGSGGHAGAKRFTTFRRVILPALVPAALTGFTLPSRARSGNTDRWSSFPATCPSRPRSCRCSSSASSNNSTTPPPP